VAVKVGVEFNRPVVVRVSGKYMSEIVVELEVAGKMVCELTRWVGEKWKVAVTLDVD
jgi:hypothetical protein